MQLFHILRPETWFQVGKMSFEPQECLMGHSPGAGSGENLNLRTEAVRSPGGGRGEGMHSA